MKKKNPFFKLVYFIQARKDLVTFTINREMTGQLSSFHLLTIYF